MATSVSAFASATIAAAHEALRNGVFAGSNSSNSSLLGLAMGLQQARLHLHQQLLLVPQLLPQPQLHLGTMVTKLRN